MSGPAVARRDMNTMRNEHASASPLELYHTGSSPGMWRLRLWWRVHVARMFAPVCLLRCLRRRFRHLLDFALDGLDEIMAPLEAKHAPCHPDNAVTALPQGKEANGARTAKDPNDAHRHPAREERLGKDVARSVHGHRPEHQERDGHDEGEPLGQPGRLVELGHVLFGSHNDEAGGVVAATFQSALDRRDVCVVTLLDAGPPNIGERTPDLTSRASVAVTSAFSAQLIAVSSIVTYDIYQSVTPTPPGPSRAPCPTA